MTATELWSDSFGFMPHKVRVYENPQKKNILYLRWRAGGNWKYRSLGVTLRAANGRIDPVRRRAALAEAERQYEILTGKRSDGYAASVAAPLTIGGTWDVIHAKDGLYPNLTPHAKEVARSLAHAVRIWGASTPWETIDRARLRMLGRTRIDELRGTKHAGYRGAELLVQRVLTVAEWLRDESRIPASACVAPRRWREDLRSYWSQVAGDPSPDPKRPRHTIAEMRALLKVAPDVDPRFALLLALGAELRLGQVVRCRRSDLSEEHRTLTVRSGSKKKGTVVELTQGQWSAWREAKAGYLANIEGAVPDYPLFPGGQLPGGRKEHGVATVERHAEAAPINPSRIKEWFREAEELAKIEHVKGRGAYGLRRVLVDAVKDLGISREGLKAHGGWADTQVPDAIYANQESMAARKEARDLRAKARGEK